MKAPHLLLLALLAAAGLPSCQSPSNDTASLAAPGSEGSFARVAGTWKLSHVGPPTISSSGAPDPASIARSQFENATITIGPDGKGTMIMAGHANRIELQIVDEADTFSKMRIKGAPDAAPFMYDAGADTLVMNMKLTVNDSEGTLPVYFRR